MPVKAFSKPRKALSAYFQYQPLPWFFNVPKIAPYAISVPGLWNSQKFGLFLVKVFDMGILLTIWQLPQLLVAWVMWLFLGDKELVAYNNNTKAYKCSKMRGSISLGRYIFMSPYGAKHYTTLLHEGGHTVDSMKFGWLYLFVIGIPSLLWAWVCNDPCKYYSFYTERRANNRQHLKVGEYCQLESVGEPEVKFNLEKNN